MGTSYHYFCVESYLLLGTHFWLFSASSTRHLKSDGNRLKRERTNAKLNHLVFADKIQFEKFAKIKPSFQCRLKNKILKIFQRKLELCESLRNQNTEKNAYATTAFSLNNGVSGSISWLFSCYYLFSPKGWFTLHCESVVIWNIQSKHHLEKYMVSSKPTPFHYFHYVLIFSMHTTS